MHCVPSSCKVSKIGNNTNTARPPTQHKRRRAGTATVPARLSMAHPPIVIGGWRCTAPSSSSQHHLPRPLPHTDDIDPVRQPLYPRVRATVDAFAAKGVDFDLLQCLAPYDYRAVDDGDGGNG